MSRTVLVTGGAGFIGSRLAGALVARGDRVRVLDNFFSSSRDAVPDGVELIEGDIREHDTVARAMDGVEVVFHQAAIRSVPRSVDEPTLSNDVNVNGTLAVLIGAERAGARRVVYASSSSAYGDSPTPVQREDQPANPMSPYGVSKLAAEMYCRVWTGVKGLSTVSLRYFNVFGPGQRPESKYAAVFPAFIRALLDGRAPEVHWDGEQTRDFSYVDDVVAANLAAADAGERADGAVVNIAGGEPMSINQVLRAVADEIGTWIEPTRTPRRAGDIRDTHADISRAREILSWKPEAERRHAIAQTVAWFRDADVWQAGT